MWGASENMKKWERKKTQQGKRGQKTAHHVQASRALYSQRLHHEKLVSLPAHAWNGAGVILPTTS
jgi:hypothetical protein